MRLNPSQVPAHLAKGLAPLYVVAGDELLLVQEALDAIRAAARKAGYGERQVLDVDRFFNWQSLLDECASLSLFSARRLIEVNLPTGSPGVEGGKVLRQIAESPPPDVLFILQCGPIDWRSRSSAWYTALEQAGAAVYAEAVKGAAFDAWLAARARSAGVAIDADGLRLLAERTEGNLLAAAQDLEKLKLLYPGETLDAARLGGAVADSARFEAFDLNDRMLEGDAAGAVRSLERLREEGYAIPEIMGAMVWTLRTLARAAMSYQKTRDAATAVGQAGVARARSAAYLKAVPRVRTVEVLQWLRTSARIDQAAKSGGEAAAWQDLLTLVLAASGAASTKSV